MLPPGVVDCAPDGTPLYAARGELSVDADEQRVRCHLCGGWYRSLGSSHLPRAHGLTADAYRELVGLLPRHALWAPDLSAQQGARLRARILTDPRLRAAAEKGRALAQRGELQRHARARLAERPASLERERQLARSGARLGSERAESHRRRRERRARSSLGARISRPTIAAATATSAPGSTSSPPSSDAR